MVQIALYNKTKMDTLLENKQDKLTAGTGISIDANNVIACGIDTSGFYTKNEADALLANKQDKLIPITFDSATSTITNTLVDKDIIYLSWRKLSIGVKKPAYTATFIYRTTIDSENIGAIKHIIDVEPLPNSNMLTFTIAEFRCHNKLLCTKKVQVDLANTTIVDAGYENIPSGYSVSGYILRP